MGRKGDRIEKLRLGVLILVVLFILPPFASAETVVLKSGKTVEGKLIEKTDKYIKMDFQGVPLTYFLDEIESIDGKNVYVAPVTESSLANTSEKPAAIEILNPLYTQPANINENIEIEPESTVEDMLKKANYYYAMHDFDKAIELCEAALKKTDDKSLIAMINFSLSSNYLEKGIDAYASNKDDSFYQLSIQSAKKCLKVYPDSWQALGNVATVYLNMSDWKQAIFYFSEAEKYLDKNDPSYAAIDLQLNLAQEMSKRN